MISQNSILQLENQSENRSRIRTLQLGMGWLPEQMGGLNRVYYDCIKHLPQSGVDVQGLVVGSEAVAQDSKGLVHAVAAQDSSLWQRWWSMRQALSQRLEENNDSLVVSHFALYASPILHELGDRPLVYHFHGPWALEGGIEGKKPLNNWARKLLEKICYRRGTKFIVLSKAFRNMLHQEYQVPLDYIHVVPPGIEIDYFDTALSRAEARARLGWSIDRPTIVAARRLTKRMGLENLIAAMQIICHQYPDVQLMIAGKGVLAETLKIQIETLGLANNVRLLGYISDEELALAYRAADFSVVPTVALEGFGLIVVESLAAGTPVLGTPVDAIPEILRPFSEDLVLEGYASEELARGIMQVLAGERQLPSSEDCQQYVREHYSWPVVGLKIRSVYEAALNL